jgi:hypothetical protein
VLEGLFQLFNVLTFIADQRFDEFQFSEQTMILDAGLRRAIKALVSE